MPTVDHHRRSLIGAAALAAPQFGLISPAFTQSKVANLPPVKPETHTSFGPLKQI